DAAHGGSAPGHASAAQPPRREGDRGAGHDRGRRGRRERRRRRALAPRRPASGHATQGRARVAGDAVGASGEAGLRRRPTRHCDWATPGALWYGDVMAIGIKRILDYEDYAAIPPDGRRWELLQGDVHVTPAPSPRHQWSSKKLQRQLEDYFEARALGQVFNAPIDVILTAHDVVQPD